MNRKELKQFYGHPQTQMANQLGIPKQRLQEWVKAGAISERTKEIADLCQCGVVELFYSHSLDNEICDGLEWLEIAIEALACFEEQTGKDVSKAVQQVKALANVKV